MTRKIIQISTCADTDNLQGTTKEYYHYVTALCDDGTVWSSLNNKGWIRLKDIPQDKPNEHTKPQTSGFFITQKSTIQQ